MNDEQTALLHVWTSFFLIAYAGYCIYWGVFQSRRTATAPDFFVAGRSLPTWVVILTLTTMSFAGWIFVGLPGLVMRDGFPAANLAFAAILVPLGGVFFLKRQWMLGKRFGFITAGELYSVYYQSEIPRYFTVLLALLFAVPVVGASLGLAGSMLEIATDGWLSREGGMLLLGSLTLVYVSAGGMRALAFACTLQSLLIAIGVAILGFAAVSLAGGMESMSRALAGIASVTIPGAAETSGYGGGNFNSYFAVSGVIQFTDGLEQETPLGGPWTGAFVLSFLLVFLGVQMSPVFSMLAFSMTDPRPLGPQQVWFGGLAVGLLLFVSATLQGVAVYLLGADSGVAQSGLALGEYLPGMEDGWHGMTVASLIRLVGQASPWLGGLLTVCMAVAITAACGAYLLSSSAILSRDIFVAYFRYDADDRRQIMFSRVAMLFLAIGALILAIFARDSMIALGALALALSLQLLPALAGVCWVPWLTRHAVVAGLLAGSAAVILTGEFGQYLAGQSLPWGQSPWTIYPTAWGLAANIVACLLVSLLSSRSAEPTMRAVFHGFFNDHDQPMRRLHGLLSTAWVATFAWVFFAIGPGSVFGNWAFGRPDAGYDGWDFQIPSIWAWQIIWWCLGVLLVWFMARGLGLSAQPAQHIAPYAEDVLALRKPSGIRPAGGTYRNEAELEA